MKVVFNFRNEFGSWVIGRRPVWSWYRETSGTHHYIVLDSDRKDLIGGKIAVPIVSVKYFILDYKGDK